MATTSARTLRLLSLLQSHRFWPGPELAGRLEVSERTLRRDVERLRHLGYPVDAARGSTGGYQLGAGATLPPLTVDEDEAIAIVVALGGAAQLTSGPLAEASVRALSKVVQVLPPRLRRRAEALRAVTDDSPFARAPEVRADVLATLAQATRDEERLRFCYRAAGGASAGEDVGRHVEPHRLVTVGQRWYLVAYDLERHDWRSFRLDRLSEPTGTRERFRARAVPGGDAATFVRRGLRQGEHEEHRVVAVVEAPAAQVAARLGQWAEVTPYGDGCRLVMQARDAHWVVFALASTEAPLRIAEATPAVHETLERWATRLAELVPGPRPERTP